MTNAYNAGRAAGIREAANAVTHEINKRYQLGVLRKRDLAELRFIRDRIDALLDNAPAPAGVTVQEAMRDGIIKGMHIALTTPIEEVPEAIASAIRALSEGRT